MCRDIREKLCLSISYSVFTVHLNIRDLGRNMKNKRKFNKFIPISLVLFILAIFYISCSPSRRSAEYKSTQNLNKDEKLVVISIIKQTYKKAFDMNRSDLSGVYQRVKINYHPRTEKGLSPPIEAVSYSYGIMNSTTASEFDDLIKNKLKPILKRQVAPLVYDEGRVSILSIHDYEIMSVGPSLIVVPLTIKIRTKSIAKTTILSHVAEIGQIDEANKLIAKGADINIRDETGRTPLHLAASQGHKVMCSLLLQKGAEVNPKSHDGFTPLHNAAYFGHLNVVKLLLMNGADINAQTRLGDTPLLAAIDQDQPINEPLPSTQLDIVKLLIDNGAKINLKRNDGTTALHFSIFYKLKEVAELLISSSPNVNERGKNLWAPLHYAVMYGEMSLIKLLFSKGALVNIANKNGDTPLHIACVFHYSHITEIVRVLINHGANVNAISKDGSTPIHLAALEGNKEIVELLISNGANVRAKRNDNSSALDLAQKYNHDDLVRLLERKTK